MFFDIGGDASDDLHDGGEVGGSIGGGGCADGDEEDVGVLGGGGEVGGGGEAAVEDVSANDAVEAWFVDGGLAAVDGFEFGGVFVDADDGVSLVGEDCSGDEPDVAGAYDDDLEWGGGGFLAGRGLVLGWVLDAVEDFGADDAGSIEHRDVFGFGLTFRHFKHLKQ